MKGRCSNPNHALFPYYGARGIRVCPRWLDSFENFFADMGLRPGRGYALERVDNSGNYEPGNVRWATMKEQGQNRRNSQLFTHDGTTLTLSAWAEKLGIKRCTLEYRLLKQGLPAHDAFTLPVRRR